MSDGAPIRHSPEQKNLATALAKAQAEVQGGVGMSGHNDHYDFDYVKLSDVVTVTRPALAKQGLSTVDTVRSIEQIVWRALDQRGNMRETPILFLWLTTRLIHSSDEWLEIETPGWGSNGDKAVYTAITGARKYAQQGLLNLGGGPEDDPESNSAHTDGAEVRSAPKGTTGKRKASDKSAPKKEKQGATPSVGKDGLAMWIDETCWGKKYGKLTWREMIKAGPDSDEEGYLVWVLEKAPASKKPPRERARYLLRIIAHQAGVQPVWDREELPPPSDEPLPEGTEPAGQDFVDGDMPPSEEPPFE